MTIVPEWLAKQAIKPSIFYSYNTDNDGINTSNNDGNDTIKDGTEDVNNNGIIDGDNGDGIYSPTECWEETDPNNDDTDSDTINDDDEILWGYNPKSNDTDSDGLNDNIEDADCDGILDEDETDPQERDTDGDGLDDIIEINGWTIIIIYESTLEEKTHYEISSNPRKVDTDNDELNDFQEYCNVTDPTKIDTDNDGKTDIQELTLNLSSNPTCIDGKPPEIWKFKCDYEEDYKQFIGINLPSGLKLNVDIGTRDLFGIKSVEIKIFGLKDIINYCNNNTNISFKCEWKINSISEYSSILFDGFTINLFATDRNGNVGLKSLSLPSVKEIIIELLGPLIKIVNIITSFLVKILNFIKEKYEKLFSLALTNFITGAKILLNPCIELLVKLGIGFQYLLENEGEKTKLEDSSGEVGGDWELTLEEVIGILLDILFSVLLLSTLVIVIKILYLALRTIINILFPSSGEAVSLTFVGIINIVCPLILNAIVGILGIALGISTTFELFDTHDPPKKLDDTVKDIGMYSSLIGKGIAIILLVFRIIALLVVKGSAATASIKTMLLLGDNSPLLWFSCLSFFMMLSFKTGIIGSKVEDQRTLFIIDVFLVSIAIYVVYKRAVMIKNLFKQIFDKTFSPINQISDWLSLGFALGAIGIFGDNLVDKYCDLNWED